MTKRIGGNEIRKLLREKCLEAGSQKAWAQANGMSAVHVCDVLQGNRAPGEKILTALGYRRSEPMYEEITR